MACIFHSSNRTVSWRWSWIRGFCWNVTTAGTQHYCPSFLRIPRPWRSTALDAKSLLFIISYFEVYVFLECSFVIFTIYLCISILLLAKELKSTTIRNFRTSKKRRQRISIIFQRFLIIIFDISCLFLKHHSIIAYTPSCLLPSK